MTDKKISELPTITGANLTGTDLIPVVDVSSNATSKVTRDEFFKNIPANMEILDSIVHSGDTNTKVRFPANDTVTVETSGSERMRITSTGNVGIGTSTPTSIVGGTDTSPVLSIGGTDTTLVLGDKAGSVSFMTNDTSYTNIYADGVTSEIASVSENAFGAAFGLAMFTGGNVGGRAERLRINQSGNVGIGETSPATLLHLTFDGSFGVRLQRTGGNAGICELKNAGNLLDLTNNVSGVAFSTGATPTEKMRINAAGNVGIGTSTPRSGLHIYGAGQTTANITDAGSQGAFLRVSDSGISGGSGGGIIFASSQSDDTGAVGFAAIKGLLNNGADNTNGHLAFSIRALVTDTALTERMRITKEGYVGIGTSSPGSKLSVVGLPTSSAGLSAGDIWNDGGTLKIV
jgi:hypothetical protein